MSLDYTGSYVNKILLPGGGRKYSGCANGHLAFQAHLIAHSYITKNLQLVISIVDILSPGTHSKGLIWLKNEAGQHFPNHLIRKGTKSILLYSHGNGGSLGDFKSITFFYAQWYAHQSTFTN